jgi:ubiquinone biosynthesis protein Coq4
MKARKKGGDPIKEKAAKPNPASSTSMDRSINEIRGKMASSNARKAGEEAVQKDIQGKIKEPKGKFFKDDIQNNKKVEFDAWQAVGNKAMGEKYESEKNRLGVKPIDRQQAIDERAAYVKARKTALSRM